ncbi:glutathione S-transferase family protein [Streptococcus halotolerans]|uniref:glutathione S-transferase family protein n=1 Tax=Streptococcus halotolerans TaxID=1814128 RepID=UPI000788F9A6|nr:glutathione S-transferase family protein [Streptococcus halotolerans]
MKLWYSKTSPFSRKVLVTIYHHHLEEQIEFALTTVAFDAQAPHNQDNPLGRVPALRTKEGIWLYGSYTIVDYLDSLSDKDKFIPTDFHRYEILALHSLADGILENAMPMLVERLNRPSEYWWNERHKQYTDRCRASFQQLEEIIFSQPFSLNIGTITAVAVIDWWILRQNYLDISLQEEFPKLIDWNRKMTDTYPELDRSWSFT